MYKDIFESIRNEAEKRNLRERTIQLYCSDVSYFLRWSGKNVSDLTLEDAESFLTAKRLEGRSPETHNHYRSAIKFLYKKVLKTVWDDDTVPAMKRERNLPAVLSRDEINAIIDATPNLKHKAIIATMYSSGLRVSEVVHLHYDDISRTNMTIHVRETKGRIGIFFIWRTHIPSGVHPLSCFWIFHFRSSWPCHFYISPSHPNHSMLFVLQKTKHFLHNFLIHPFPHRHGYITILLLFPAYL